VLFSPNGKYLATNSGKNIRLWDVEKWLSDKKNEELIAEFKGHQEKITSLVFSPKDPASFETNASDRRLITSSSDGTIRMWDWTFPRPDNKADLNTLIARGCDWVQDYLRSNPKLKQDACSRNPSIQR
jgi:WD40 repeat protein